MKIRIAKYITTRTIIFALNGGEFILDGKSSEEYTNIRILIRAYKPTMVINIKNINCKTIFFQRLDKVDSLILESITLKRLGKFLYKYSL